jgi:hypothetical protein
MLDDLACCTLLGSIFSIFLLPNGIWEGLKGVFSADSGNFSRGCEDQAKLPALQRHHPNTKQQEQQPHACTRSEKTGHSYLDCCIVDSAAGGWLHCRNGTVGFRH